GGWGGGAGGTRVGALEGLRVPAFANGQGRGCLRADHPLALSRTRALLKSEADLVVVVGTPLDFRLSFGSFGDATVVHVVDSADGAARHVDALTLAGDLGTTLAGLAGHAGPCADHEPWIARLRAQESAAAEADRARLEAAATPILPARIYGELARRRRLRLLRRALRLGVPTRVLARQWSLRLPRHRHGVRDRGPGRAPGSPGGGPARRRRRRVLAHGRRHARAPPPARGHGGRQQRDLGSREAPDADALRLRRGRRSATWL